MTAILLDRDGVLIRKARDGEYVSDWREVEFLPGALEAIAAFCRSGRKVIIITNQRGIATGKIRPEKLEDIHKRIKQMVATCGGQIAAIYCCPHDLSDECGCRKPKPGMLLRAAHDFKLHLEECWMIGDAAADIAAAKAASCKAALISQTSDYQQWPDKPDFCAESLAAAAEQILRR